jgi:lipoate-protein ligase A
MRFIDLGSVDPAYGLAADRAIFESRSRGTTGDTLHIYTRDRPTVSVGRFGDIEETVHTGYARDRGIAVLRRMSGGSSIYTDRAQVIYGVTVGRSEYNDREGSFAMICEALVASLEHLGVAAEHKPPNDVLADGRKISGSAQYRDREVVVQHGTLILDLDPANVMDKVLRNPKIRSYSGMTSVRELIGEIPDRPTLAFALMCGFSETLGESVDFGELTPWEKERILELTASVSDP